MSKKVKIIGVVVYFIFGLYFINYAFNFVVFPEFIANLDKWIILVGGILIFIGGVNYLRVGKKLVY